MKKGTGGNLSQPKMRFLINSLSAADFGVFTDTVTGLKSLIAKKLGYSFESLAGGTNVEVTKQCTDAGQLKVVSVDFNNDCPCTECGFDYGINIAIRHMIPGYFNDMTDRQKPYSGNIANINCVSGKIDSTQIDTMKDDIINQINADLGFSNPLAGANVIAGKALHITGWDANDTITINGTAYTHATIAGLIAAINAGTDAYAFLDPTTPATEFWIIANSTPTTFVVTSLNMTVPPNYTIGIISKSVQWNFNAEIQPLDATGTITVIQESVFPFLTSDDVFRIFSGGAHPHGAHATQAYIQQPVDGASYCRYIISVDSDINDLTGASHWEHFRGTVEFYIQTNANNIGDLWDSDITGANTGWMAEPGDGVFVAASDTFAELLTYWQS